VSLDIWGQKLALVLITPVLAVMPAIQLINGTVFPALCLFYLQMWHGDL
jgi:hypothetical protein